MAIKGVIVAAGYGTRLLPVTRVVPKELLPLVDRPCIASVIDELVAAGVEDVLIITSRRKRTLDDWFDRDPELEAALAGSPRLPSALPQGVRATFVRQPRMGGTGDALMLAREFAANDPVIVAYPDDLFDPPGAAVELVDVFRRTGTSVLSAAHVDGDVSRYGVLDVAPGPGDVVVRRIVEKPAPGTEPSQIVSLGRYLYTPELFDALERHKPATPRGEYYPMDATNELAAAGRMHAAMVAVTRYDTGSALGYAQTFIEFALRRPDMGPELSRWLRGRLDGQG
ncbi:MAG TPA: UTP--glucose-1-phosphate uridylyltransferase [Myxococcota bacterium]|nr:UTP--glucose-1-phosphate uridylyltransferase [Myxococcota bacterium]